MVYSPLVLGVLLVLLLSAVSVTAQSRDTRTWYQAYADAQQKIQQKDYNGAIADLDAAVKAGAPKPGRNVNFYGDVYRDYNPDYYRGVALAALGRLDEADKAFERVRDAKLIAAKDPLNAEFTRLTASVRDSIAQRTANAVTGGAKPPPPPGGTTTGSGTGAPPPAGVDPSGVTPQGVNTPGINTGDVNTSKPPAGSPAGADSGRSNASGATPPVTADTGSRGKAPDLSARARGASASRVKSGPGSLEPGPVSDALRERTALVSYFSGDYGAAAAALRSIAATDAATPRTYLYLACSETALVLTGQSPRTALNDARTLVARVGDTTALARDLLLISPRIRQELGLRP